MDLIEEIKNDIEKGSIRLFAEYRDRLYFEALRLAGDAAAADDLVMVAMDRAIRGIDSYDSRKSEFFTWLKAILLNCRRDALRRFSATRERLGGERDVAEEEAGVLSDESTEDEIFRRSDADALRAAIGTLKRDEREMIMMHYFGEMSVGQIAKFIHASNWAVQWRLRMARKALAARLAPAMGRAAAVSGVAVVALALGLWSMLTGGEPTAVERPVAVLASAPAVAAAVEPSWPEASGQTKVGLDYARQFAENVAVETEESL